VCVEDELASIRSSLAKLVKYLDGTTPIRIAAEVAFDCPEIGDWQEIVRDYLVVIEQNLLSLFGCVANQRHPYHASVLDLLQTVSERTIAAADAKRTDTPTAQAEQSQYLTFHHCDATAFQVHVLSAAEQTHCVLTQFIDAHQEALLVSKAAASSESDTSTPSVTDCNTSSISDSGSDIMTTSGITSSCASVGDAAGDASTMIDGIGDTQKLTRIYEPLVRVLQESASFNTLAISNSKVAHIAVHIALQVIRHCANDKELLGELIRFTSILYSEYLRNKLANPFLERLVREALVHLLYYIDNTAVRKFLLTVVNDLLVVEDAASSTLNTSDQSTAQRYAA
jgi:hypothetical protein